MTASRSASAADPFGLVGTIVDGQFRVDQWVGDGGFSAVYKGFHLGLSEAVAVKCLKIPRDQPKALIDQFTHRFRDESRIAYRLSQGNLHIVRSTTSGTLTSADGALVPYMILEWLDGESLASELRRRREQKLTGRPLEDAVRDLTPAAEALAYAHAHGVVHRDVKPGNLFVARTREGTRMKVLDFGMAKILSDGDLGVSPLAQSMGRVAIFSAPYAAPEQFDPRYGTVGAWTDVYSFALVLLEVLADRRVRNGDGLAECLMQAVNEQARPTPSSMGIASGPALNELFRRALSIRPQERPQDLGELWGQLRNAMLRDAGNKGAHAAPPTNDDDAPDSFDGDGPATIVTDTTGMFDSDDGDEPTRTVDLHATMPLGAAGGGGPGAVPNDVRDFLRQQQATPALGAPIVRPASPSPAAGTPPDAANPFGPTVGVGVMSPFAGGVPQQATPGAPMGALPGTREAPSSDKPTMAVASPALAVPPNAPVPGAMGFGATMPLQGAQFPGVQGGPMPNAPVNMGVAPMGAMTSPMSSSNAPPPMGAGEAPQGLPPGMVPYTPGAPPVMQGGMMHGAPGMMPGAMPPGMQGMQPGGMPPQGMQPIGAAWNQNAPNAQGAAPAQAQGAKDSKAPAIVVGVIAGVILLGTIGYLGLQYARGRATAGTAPTASVSAAPPPSAAPSAVPADTAPVASASATDTAAASAAPTADTTAAPTATQTAAPTAQATAGHTSPTTSDHATTHATASADTQTRPTQLPTPLPSGTATATAKATASAAPAEPGAFSQSEAQKALRSMESILASCKRPDGPTGAGHVRVTFANDGSAMSSVILGPPYEGTPVGDCAASRFKLAHVTKFDGPPGVVDYTFHINK